MNMTAKSSASLSFKLFQAPTFAIGLEKCNNS